MKSSSTPFRGRSRSPAPTGCCNGSVSSRAEIGGGGTGTNAVKAFRVESALTTGFRRHNPFTIATYGKSGLFLKAGGRARCAAHAERTGAPSTARPGLFRRSRRPTPPARQGDQPAQVEDGILDGLQAVEGDAA